MPEISRFLGVVVTMNFNEHPPPHFHARYAEFEATIVIRPLRFLAGHLPARTAGIVVEWALLHEPELLRNWYLTQDGKPPNRIAPLG
jgi:hypothetical protein